VTKKYDSTDEMTAIVPRPEPMSVVPGPTIEQIADVERLRREAPTLVPCPWCAGLGMVSVDRRAEWLAAYAELSDAGRTHVRDVT